MAGIPTTVIGGFLGSGKTTLVNRILSESRGRRIAVMVNDFGEISIDAALIQSADGPVTTLANGCVCCSINGDLMQAMSLILDRGEKPDYLVIEASGVADPDKIADIARAEPDLALHAVVTLADADRISDLACDRRIRSAILKQLACADIILLNKIDLVGDPKHALALVAGAAPGVPVIETVHSRLPWNVLLDDPLPGSGDNAPDQRRVDFHADHDHDHEKAFARWSGRCTFRPTLGQLNDLLARLPHNVIRLKGFLQTADGGPVCINAVGRRRIVMPDPRPATGDQPFVLTAIGFADSFAPADLDLLFGIRPARTPS